MQPLAIGACSGAFGIDNAAEMFAKAAELGVEVIQLSGLPRRWTDRKARDVLDEAAAAGVEVISATIGHAGEDYSTLETIRDTGGVTIDFQSRLDDYRRAGDWLAEAGVADATSHMGFIPEDPADPHRQRMLDRIAAVADVLAERGLRLALETGQESAEGLLDALRAINRPEIGVNLDPANMILYGSGDPMAAIDVLGPRIRSVHCKDAVASDAPGRTWGEEVPFGRGDVRAEAWLDKLIDSGFDGPMVIEREAGATRFADIASAVSICRASRLRAQG